MNQEKIGRFIAECRKEKNLTQSELAEKLGVTEKSISNWENGRNMPDLSLFKPLCNVFGISINDLLSGEKIDIKDYNDRLEENMVNTINYIDKKNNKNKNFVSVSFIVLGVLFTASSLLLLSEGTIKDFLTVIGMIITINGINQLTNRYPYFKRLIILAIMAMCMLSIMFVFAT